MNDMSLYYKDINSSCSSESFKGVKKDMLIIPYTIIIYILRRFVFKNKYLMWLTIFLFDKLKYNIL